MAESDFSWLKIASFIGALVLAVLAFVAIASGINFIISGNALYGVCSVIAGALCGFGAYLVYQHYQNKSSINRYGR